MSGPQLAFPARHLVRAYVLVGGRSRRLGRPKVAERLEGRLVVEHLAEQVAPYVDGVWLVAKKDQELPPTSLPVCRDDAGDHALVHGLEAALRAPGPPWRWILACDMPGITAAHLAQAWRAARQDGSPGAAFQRPDVPHVDPVPSLWRADVLQRADVAGWGLQAQSWVRAAGLARVHLDPEAIDPLANLNTPSEWAAYTGEARTDV